MPNNEHVDILKRGVEYWNQWRKQNKGLEPDLSGAELKKLYLRNANLRNVNLSHADLRKTNLRSSHLREANLCGANLWRASFIEADLSFTNLSYANLNHANLRGAQIVFADLNNAQLKWAKLYGASLIHTNLSNTNFEAADLSLARFIDVDFTEANLSGATLISTAFNNLDLSTVRGLDNLRHLGPSSIGIETLYKSAAKIPKMFLYGCGIPDEFIDYLPLLLGEKQAIQFYSCFISHSHKDEEFARRLYSRLRESHIRVWFAPEDVKGGQKLHEQIDRAIQIHDKILIVLSQNSLQSQWVMTEIREARDDEVRDKRRKLFPIRLVDFDTLQQWKCFDASIGKDLAVEVREYYIPDFSHWMNQDEFETAFQRLLRDLKAEESPQGSA
jgi:uncharacterized protein YjbI with pentapeptide repeats